MKIRNIARQFQPVVDIGYKNLIVSGCSFTYNNSDDTAVTWPYYLRDLANINSVYDCSLPGAGNFHICHSMIWSLEKLQLPPEDTLVIVMWSGHSRDDEIIDKESLNDYPMRFYYSDQVVTGITGGRSSESLGNNVVLKNIDQIKSAESRSIENFLYVTCLYNYLKQKNYKFLFLDFLDRRLPNRANDFAITDYLDKSMGDCYRSMFSTVENLYRYSLKKDLLMDDDLHPNPDAHLGWTKDQLLPYLLNQLQTKTP